MMNIFLANILFFLVGKENKRLGISGFSFLVIAMLFVNKNQFFSFESNLVPNV